MAVGRAYAVGDEVLALRNDRHLGVLNGTKAKVVAIDHEHRQLVVDSDGRRRTLPAAYLDGGHLTHGYAMTVHKAQGATVDAAFLLGDDGLLREAGYVGLSRGRRANHLYRVEGPEAGPDQHGPQPERRSDADRAPRALGRPRGGPEGREASGSLGRSGRRALNSSPLVLATLSVTP